MSHWKSLKENTIYTFGLIQIDIVGHSKWSAPDIRQKQTKANLRNYLGAFAKYNLDVRELHWAGDGGSFFIPIIKPENDYDLLVYCALHFLHSLDEFNGTPILNTIGEPINIRVSCHVGQLIYSSNYGNLHSPALNYFFKYEREISSESTVTITEELYQQLTKKDLRDNFKEVESHGYRIGTQHYAKRLYRYIRHEIILSQAEPKGEYERNLPIAKEKKLLIARYVVDRFIRDNDALLLDAGTSVFFVAKTLVDRWRVNKASWSKLAIRTHSLPCWSALSEINDGSIDNWLIGGRFNSSIQAFLDPGHAQDVMEDFFPTVTIIGVNSLSTEGAFYCEDKDELPIKQLFVKKDTETRIILADDTKIGIAKAERFVTLDELFKNDKGIVLVVTN